MKRSELTVMMTEVVEERRSIQLQRGHCIAKKVENNGNEIMGGRGEIIAQMHGFECFL